MLRHVDMPTYSKICPNKVNHIEIINSPHI